MFVLFHIQNFYYIYSATGEKLATNANGSLTYYRSVMVYGNDNKLLYMLTPKGGRVVKGSNHFTPTTVNEKVSS